MLAAVAKLTVQEGKEEEFKAAGVEMCAAVKASESGRTLLVRDFYRLAHGDFPWSTVAKDVPYHHLTAALVLDDVQAALRPGLWAYLLIVNTSAECVVGGLRADVEKLAAAVGKPVTLLGRPRRADGWYDDAEADRPEPGIGVVLGFFL